MDQNKERLGESKRMNNGMLATITEYRSASDIDVQFEDGSVREHVSYCLFARGSLSNPNLKYKNGVSLQEFAIFYYLRHLGFCKINKGEWKEKGFGRFELDLCNINAKSAIEYDGGFHRTQNALKRDKIKNAKCKKLGVKLYRIRDQICPSTGDDAVEFFISNKNKISTGYYDCKKELEAILADCNINVDPDFIDFVRDEDAIKEEYNSTHVNCLAKQRIGEKSWSYPANQTMTLIEYHDAYNITIRFEDDVIRKNVAYAEFLRGAVAHPNQRAEGRIGETRQMNNGRNAKIIAYRKATDIDVQFEDGFVKEHVTYDCFIKGSIAYKMTDIQIERLGQSKIMNNGERVEIIEYFNKDNIAVKFQNGVVLHNVSYDRYQNGTLQSKYTSFAEQKLDEIKTTIEQRIGETRRMINGESAAIIGYRSASDIDIKFDDGTIRCNVSYASFKKGEIAKKSKADTTKERLGQINIMNCGSKATIIVYRSSTDIDVQFENGVVRKHVTYHSFVVGEIAPLSANDRANKRLGERKMMNCGQPATIVEYVNSRDITVQFDDGVKCEHVTYYSFTKQCIQHPNYDTTLVRHATSRIGEKRVMNCGIVCVISAYRSATDIDVLFDNGVMRTGVEYSQFKKGQIALIAKSKKAV